MAFLAGALIIASVLGAVGGTGEMHFTIGNDVGLQVKTLEEARSKARTIAAGAANARVTAFEPYVKWMLLEPEEGKWDFTYYDMLVSEFRSQGVKWVPFLIAGPAYSTPEWFKKSSESVFARCLEHSEETRTQSIWNPAMPGRVDSLMRAFAGHYSPDNIQMILLGISGDFGESIFTVSGNYWTYIWDGEYHHHAGWWCGDRYAAADFQRAMRAKYRTIDALNRAWSTTLAGFDQVEPFIPDGTHTRHARLDMTRWYRGSMTHYTEMWLQTVRRYFPKTPVTICTGGEGDPALGADFSEQAVAAARNGCGMRITNEASDYARNFVITRWVGSACRNLGAYFGYEPAGEVNDHGIVARIFNAVASGADELFVYDNPPSDERGAIYARYRDLLKKRKPSVPIALFLPKTSQELGLWGDLYAHAAAFRDYTDFDFIDETLIAHGLLDRYQALVWLDGPVTDDATLRRIGAWTAKGGRLFCRVSPENVDGVQQSESLSKTRSAMLKPDTEVTAFFHDIVAAAPSLLVDGKADHVYWTRFTDGSALVLNYSDTPYQAGAVTVAPWSIGELVGAPSR